MKKLSKDYNLKAMYPEVAKEWHPTKNDNLNLNNFNPSIKSNLL